MFKIITHDGRAHMDEIAAIALLKVCFGDLEVERRRTLPSDLRNTLVLDEGKNYKEFNVGKIINFGQIIDHHQSKDLPSTAMLIHDSLVYQGYLPYLPYIDDLLVTVSNRDLHGPSGDRFEASDLIQVMKFEDALNYVYLWFKGIYDSLHLRVVQIGMYNNIPMFEIMDDSNNLPGERIITKPSYFIKNKFSSYGFEEAIALRRGGCDLPKEWEPLFSELFLTYFAKSKKLIHDSEFTGVTLIRGTPVKIIELITMDDDKYKPDTRKVLDNYLKASRQ